MKIDAASIGIKNGICQKVVKVNEHGGTKRKPGFCSLALGEKPGHHRGY